MTPFVLRLLLRLRVDRNSWLLHGGFEALANDLDYLAGRLR